MTAPLSYRDIGINPNICGDGDGSSPGGAGGANTAQVGKNFGATRNALLSLNDAIGDIDDRVTVIEGGGSTPASRALAVARSGNLAGVNLEASNVIDGTATMPSVTADLYVPSGATWTLLSSATTIYNPTPFTYRNTGSDGPLQVRKWGNSWLVEKSLAFRPYALVSGEGTPDSSNRIPLSTITSIGGVASLTTSASSSTGTATREIQIDCVAGQSTQRYRFTLNTTIEPSGSASTSWTALIGVYKNGAPLSGYELSPLFSGYENDNASSLKFRGGSIYLPVNIGFVARFNQNDKLSVVLTENGSGYTTLYANGTCITIEPLF